VARNTGEFVQDLFTLSELQLRLLLVDLRQGLWSLVPPVALLLIGLAFALSCLPVAMMTLAWALIETANLAHWRALAVALLAGIGLTLIFLIAAWVLLRRQEGMFLRSGDEWRQNLKWVKDAIRRQGRPPFGRSSSTSTSSHKPR
jgi:putative superfamily III holin-X